MNNIVELQHTTYENSYIGYKKDVLNFLRGQLKMYVEDIPADKIQIDNGSYTCFEDFDHEHMQIVAITSEVIVNIEECAKDNSLIIVDDVLFESMKWNYADISVR